jgi:hypothetical protein
MRKLLFIPLFVALTACEENSNLVKITGKVIGEIPDKIHYTVPVNETTFYYGFHDSVEPDSLGNFSIETRINNPSFIKIFFRNRPIVIAEPGKNYSIIITQDENNHYSTEFMGQNAVLNEIYSSFEHINPSYCSWLNEMPKTQETLISLDERYLQELRMLDSIAGIQDFDPFTLELIRRDRKLYYSFAKSKIGASLFTEYLFQDDIFHEEAYQMWQSGITSSPGINKDIIHLNYAHDFLQDYFWFNIYSTYKLKDFRKMNDEYRAKNRMYSLRIELAREYFQDDLLEFYIAGFICFFSRMVPDNPDDFINIIQIFREEFPESNYQQFIDPIYQTAVASLEIKQSE